MKRLVKKLEDELNHPENGSAILAQVLTKYRSGFFNGSQAAIDWGEAGCH